MQMGSTLPLQVSQTERNNEETILLSEEAGKERETIEQEQEHEEGERLCGFGCSALQWFRMLARETHWSFVYGVVITYGISQGLGGGVKKVATDYYWKDVQKVNPASSQVYQGISYLPWIVKPVWGILTDALPIAGYRRRPYFILAGLLGVISMLMLSFYSKLHVVFALLAMTAGSASVAMADVTIDACITENSMQHPSLAADMQTLCNLFISIGRLLGYCISGLLVHAIGSQGVLGMLSIPSALILSIGMILKEIPMPGFDYRQIHQKAKQVCQTMLAAIKCPEVWKPCAYMYISFSLSLNIQEGMFYWLTDPKVGPSFSQDEIGFILSIGSAGAVLGVILYQNILKEISFRSLLFWSQLLAGFAGMLDLMMVFRLNLKLGMPDYFFAVIAESVFQVVDRLKWMPILVLSSKLCPPGIEGTFYALLMSIDNSGELTASWCGGLLLRSLMVTRTEFSNLWIAILVRNIIRVLPLALIFLVPIGGQDSSVLPVNILNGDDHVEAPEEKSDSIELVALVGRT